MAPITVIPIILAIALIPPVLEPDSDPIAFLNKFIPSFEIACAGLMFDCDLLQVGSTDVEGNVVLPECGGSDCEAAGGTCRALANSVNSNEISCVCEFPGVGGWFFEVDKPALLVVGAQMNAAWMIPLIVSAIGIGIVIARKF